MTVPKFEVKLEPVSSRLKATLVHPTRRGFIGNIQFSPDGGRVIGGSYREGVIQLWEAATGRQLAKIDTPPDSARSYDYFAVAPEWSLVYTMATGRNYERVEREGKTLIRWKMDGAVRSWDAATGAPRRTYRDDPPSNPVHANLSPDGRWLMVGGELSGEVAGAPTRGASLCDLTTGTIRPLPNDLSPHCLFMADSKTLAVARQNGDYDYRWIDLFDTATAKCVRTIATGVEFGSVHLFGISPAGRRLYGGVHSYPAKGDRSNSQFRIAAWDVTTGKEVGSFAAPEPKTFLMTAPPSPDGRTVAAVLARSERASLYLLDAEALTLRKTVDLGPKLLPRSPVFRPDGKLVALVVQAEVDRKDSRSATPEDYPQPKVYVIDATTGDLRAAIVLPQCFCGSLAVSPDGKTLAAGGSGQVLLFDVGDL